jgi:hypothetical protein
MKTLKERVEEALSNGVSREYFAEYTKSVAENIRDTESKFHRSILFLIFSIVVFELITQASIAEVSLGPFKLSNLSSIQKFLPSVVAYFYLEVISIALMRRLLTLTFTATMKVTHSPIYDSDLDYFQLPHLS